MGGAGARERGIAPLPGWGRGTLGVCNSCNQGVRPCDGFVYRGQDGKVAFLHGIDFRPFLVLNHSWRPGLLPPVPEKLAADLPGADKIQPISSPS